MKYGTYMKFLRIYANYKLGRYIPAIVTLRLTGKCNQDCDFCDVKDRFDQEVPFSHVLSLLDDMKKLGTPYLNITGGEPVLHKNILGILKEARRRRIFVTLNTNATLVTSKNAGRIARYANIVKISFDGLRKTHDSMRGRIGEFEKGLRGLRLLKKHKARVMVHFVANKKNYKHMEQYLRFFNGMVDKITIMPEFRMHEGVVFNDSDFIREWKRLQQKYDLQESNFITKDVSFSFGKDNCDAGRLYFSILPNSDIIGCSNNFNIKYGNLNDTSLSQVVRKGWRNEKLHECPGCFCRSTSEISSIMRCSPFELALKGPGLIRRFGLFK